VLAALGTVVGLVDGALMNDGNAAALRDRSLLLLRLVVARRAGLLAGDGRAYRSIMSRFLDVLQNVVCFAQAYSGRGWALKLLFSRGDAEHFAAMAGALDDLVDDVTLTVGARAQAGAAGAAARLRQVAAYQARPAVAGAGVRSRRIALPSLLSLMLGRRRHPASSPPRRCDFDWLPSLSRLLATHPLPLPAAYPPPTQTSIHPRNHPTSRTSPPACARWWRRSRAAWPPSWRTRGGCGPSWRRWAPARR
jgi:hypothetical protein